MAATNSKSALRARVREARITKMGDLQTNAVNPWSTQAISLARRLGTTTVAAYAPLPSEPGGDTFVPELIAAFGHVLLPTAHADKTMTWVDCTNATRMTKGLYGIDVPEGKELRVLPRSVGLILVPALAVSQEGIRLGQGGGFYDRFFAAHRNLPKAAVVWSDEILETVPHDPHDVRVDWIIDEQGTKRVTA